MEKERTRKRTYVVDHYVVVIMAFFVGEADIESAYTPVRALPWMWLYQCLPGVLAAEIMTQEELKNGEMASHRAHLPAWGPRCTVLSPTLHGTFLDRRNYVAYC